MSQSACVSNVCLSFFPQFLSDKFTRFCQWKNVELNIHVSRGVPETPPPKSPAVALLWSPFLCCKLKSLSPSSHRETFSAPSQSASGLRSDSFEDKNRARGARPEEQLRAALKNLLT